MRDLDWSDVVADGERMRDEQEAASAASDQQLRITVLEQALGRSVDTQLLWDVLQTLARRGERVFSLSEHDDGERILVLEPNPEPDEDDDWVIVQVRDPYDHEYDECEFVLAGRQHL